MPPNAGNGPHRELGYPISIIDDHELYSTSLQVALAARGFDVHQFPVRALPALPMLPVHCELGLALLDLALGLDADGAKLSGAKFVADLCGLGWTVLIVSGNCDECALAEAFDAGAVGMISKASSFDALLDSIISVAAGEPMMSRVERERWIARHRRCKAEEQDLAVRLGKLSPREREVLRLLADGLRAEAIAEHFFVSLTTVRSQIRSIHAKLEVSSQIEAIALMRKHLA
jgi:DNA-binding NarL/FixJ family response regulator